MQASFLSRPATELRTWRTTALTNSKLVVAPANSRRCSQSVQFSPSARNTRLKKPSPRVTEAKTRAKLDDVGIHEGDLGKPKVGISTVWCEGNTCNIHLLKLSEEVKWSVEESGLVGFKFNTDGVSGGISMGTRERWKGSQSSVLIAGRIETVIGARQYVGNISIPGCDKNGNVHIVMLTRAIEIMRAVHSKAILVVYHAAKFMPMWAAKFMPMLAAKFMLKLAAKFMLKLAAKLVVWNLVAEFVRKQVTDSLARLTIDSVAPLAIKSTMMSMTVVTFFVAPLAAVLVDRFAAGLVDRFVTKLVAKMARELVAPRLVTKLTTNFVAPAYLVEWLVAYLMELLMVKLLKNRVEFNDDLYHPFLHLLLNCSLDLCFCFWYLLIGCETSCPVGGIRLP